MCTSSPSLQAPSSLIETVRPQTETQLIEFIRWAGHENCRIGVIGGGSKTALGRPMKIDKQLDMSGLQGISLYQPEELVMTAFAGTSRAEIETVLATKKQRLAFEPADWGTLFGHQPNSGSIGGVFCLNLSGPRRFQAGAARDHLLGFCAINGRGESFHSGGRVVKNVSGYDLCKLICGSFGTLAVVTETTFKVMPASSGQCTLFFPDWPLEAASAGMIGLLRTPLPITGLAYLPVGCRHEKDALTVAGLEEYGLAVRLEAPAQALEATCHAVTRHLEALEEIPKKSRAISPQILDEETSPLLWQWIGAAAAFSSCKATQTEAVLWRIHIPPARFAEVISALHAEGPLRYLGDWGGGLLWVAPQSSSSARWGNDGGAATIRRIVTGEDVSEAGYAVLMRAPVSIRRQDIVFEPQTPPMVALTNRIKKAFDPLQILNPGRMYRDL